MPFFLTFCFFAPSHICDRNHKLLVRREKCEFSAFSLIFTFTANCFPFLGKTPFFFFPFRPLLPQNSSFFIPNGYLAAFRRRRFHRATKPPLHAKMHPTANSGALLELSEAVFHPRIFYFAPSRRGFQKSRMLEKMEFLQQSVQSYSIPPRWRLSVTSSALMDSSVSRTSAVLSTPLRLALIICLAAASLKPRTFTRL